MRHCIRILPLLALTLSAVDLAAQDAPTMQGAPLSLEDAVQMAEARSPAVRIARAAVTRQRGAEMQARSQIFPQLFGSAGYTRTLRSQFAGLGGDDTSTVAPPPGPCDAYLRDAGATLEERVSGLELASRCAIGTNPFTDFSRFGFGALHQYQLGLSLSQNLFSGGRVQAQIAAARSARAAAEIQLSSERAQLALDVAAAYFDAALAERLVSIAELSLRQSEVTVTQAQLGHEVGTTSEFEMLRARVARDNQRPVVIQRRADRDIAFLRLRQLLGVALDEPLTLSTPVEDTSAATAAVRVAAARLPLSPGAPTQVEGRAPVRQAAAGVDAQNSQLRVARAQRLPQVSVTSQYGRIAYPLAGLPANDEFRENWTVGVGVQVPLFTGGRIRGEETAARAALEEARGRLDQVRQLAELDARVQETALQTALAAWEASAGTAEQAERAYRIAEVRYREGISTQLELDDSRLLLEQAQVNRALAARNLQVARVRLALLPELPLQLDQAGNFSGAAPVETGIPIQSAPAPTQAQTQMGTTAAPAGTPPGITIP